MLDGSTEAGDCAKADVSATWLMRVFARVYSTMHLQLTCLHFDLDFSSCNSFSVFHHFCKPGHSLEKFYILSLQRVL